MSESQNSCYEIAKKIKEISEAPHTQQLNAVIEQVYGAIPTVEAKLRFIQSFDGALDEVSLLPKLPEEEVGTLIQSVRAIQGSALLALAQAEVKGFVSHIKSAQSIHTLKLIGHTIASSDIAKQKPFDRIEFIHSTEAMLEETRNAPINEMQKAVLELKLKSIIRIMHECEGTNEAQVRQKLKSIFADVSAEFIQIDAEQKEYVEKFKDWVSSSMKGGAFALGLTADALSVLSIAGPVAAIALLQAPEENLMIEGPTTSTSDQADEAGETKPNNAQPRSNS